MRPITVSVGPIAAANATAICAAQTPTAAGTFLLNGSLATQGFVGTGSIAGNVLTITAVQSGVINSGVLNSTVISGFGVPGQASGTPNLFGINVDGVLTGTNQIGTYVLSGTASVASTTIYGNAVATLDVPRRVLFTTAANETGKTITLIGTDLSGTLMYETLAAPNTSTVQSVLSYKSVFAILISAAAAGNISVGTSAVADSPWVRFDDFANAQVSIQASVTGTANYTLQTTQQDPNSPGNPILPYQMTWVNSLDATMVAASTSLPSSFSAAPVYARVVLNSGSGSVSATFTQSGVVPY